MAFPLLSRARAPRSSWLLALLLVTLAACTTTHIGPVGSAARGVERRHFSTANALIRALNQRGVSCQLQRSRHPDNAFFAYKDSGSCVFHSGHTLMVWIVKDAEKTFRTRIAYFLKTPNPARYFYRQNWLVIASKSIPEEAVTTIRDVFRAHLRQNLS